MFIHLCTYTFNRVAFIVIPILATNTCSDLKINIYYKSIAPLPHY